MRFSVSFSIDYNRNDPVAHDFYAMVQNKFHYAITGQAAAEIIHSPADLEKDHTILITWKNALAGHISKKAADDTAKAEYDVFSRTQRITSDFDLEIKRLRDSQ